MSLIKITRTVSLRGHIVIEVPDNVTAEQIREAAKEGTFRFTNLPVEVLKIEGDDIRAEYTQEQFHRTFKGRVADQMLLDLGIGEAPVELVADEPVIVEKPEAPKPAKNKTAKKK